MEPDDRIDPMPWILEMHEEDYVKELKRTCEAGEKLVGGSADNPISPRTYEVAVKAVAASLTAVDAVMEGRVNNAFAAVRPPGHHAMPHRAKGFNLNVPPSPGGGDEAVLKAYRTQLTDAFRKFKPQLLIISAGFDAHEADPLGSLGWSSDVYAELTEILRALCRKQGHERIVSLLEGGYSERGITEGVRRHIEALEAPAEKP